LRFESTAYSRLDNFSLFLLKSALAGLLENNRRSLSIKMALFTVEGSEKVEFGLRVKEIRLRKSLPYEESDSISFQSILSHKFITIGNGKARIFWVIFSARRVP